MYYCLILENGQRGTTATGGDMAVRERCWMHTGDEPRRLGRRGSRLAASSRDPRTRSFGRSLTFARAVAGPESKAVGQLVVILLVAAAVDGWSTNEKAGSV